MVHSKFSFYILNCWLFPLYLSYSFLNITGCVLYRRMSEKTGVSDERKSDRDGYFVFLSSSPKQIFSPVTIFQKNNPLATNINQRAREVTVYWTSVFKWMKSRVKRFFLSVLTQLAHAFTHSNDSRSKVKSIIWDVFLHDFRNGLLPTITGEENRTRKFEVEEKLIRNRSRLVEKITSNICTTVNKFGKEDYSFSSYYRPSPILLRVYLMFVYVYEN